MDALGLDYEVEVLSDATASKSDQVQENNLEGKRSAGENNQGPSCESVVMWDSYFTLFDVLRSIPSADMRCMGIRTIKTAEWAP